MRSVKVRYSNVTREAKKRFKDAERLADNHPQTPERVEEERILSMFRKRAREDYGISKSKKHVTIVG